MQLLQLQSIPNFICSFGPKLFASLVLGASLLAPVPVRSDQTDSLNDDWSKIERLVSEQKLRAASDQLKTFIEKASSDPSPATWTQAVVLRVRLQIALHGYETAIRELLERPWPKDFLSGVLLHLTAAKALTDYAEAYTTEIKKRERTGGTDAPQDLKFWTMPQIYSEAERHFAELWKERARLEQYRPEQLQKYFETGNTPPGVRPTLRDTYAYLYADLLSDKRGWSSVYPDEEFEFKTLLDRTALDPTRLLKHQPLLRLAAVLNDLEASHLNRNPEAALEARLELLRKVFPSGTVTDRELMIRDLEKELDQFRSRYSDKPWWAAGMALLAQLIENSDGPRALLDAHGVAKTCAAGFPETVGGNQCRAIQKRIEAPSYEVSSMAVDGIDRPAIQVTYKNLNRLYFRAFSFDLKKALRRKDFRQSDPSSESLQELLNSRQPDFCWSSELRTTPDFRSNEMLLKHQITRNGFYRVVVSGQPDFKAENNSLAAFYFTVSPFVITDQQFSGAIEFKVYEGGLGGGISEALAVLYRHRVGHVPEKVSVSKTDKSGVVRFDRSGARESYFLLTEKDGLLGWQPYIPDFQGQENKDEQSVAFYTDRNIYRPHQKIYWKIVALSKRSGMPSLRSSTRLRVELLDSNQQVVHTKVLLTNRFGTASGEFVIPGGKLAGLWSLRSGKDEKSIRVEEYKRPTFEVKILDPRIPLQLGQKVELVGEARYYFGQQLNHGSVRWRVEREPTDRFGFESVLIASGGSKMQSDGSFLIHFTPSQPLEKESVNPRAVFRYRITAELTDEGGETRETQRSFVIGSSSLEAVINPEAGYYNMHQRPKFSVNRRTLDGAPSPGVALYKIFRLQLPEQINLAENQPRWRTDFTAEAYVKEKGVVGSIPLGKGSVTHDHKGEARIELESLPAGVYRIIYETIDALGGKCTAERDFMVVAENGSALPVPLFLGIQKKAFKVGETARIYVSSGWKNQDITLELYRNGKRLKKREFRSGELGPVGLLEIPITEELRGGFSVTLSSVHDYRFITETAAAFVPWDHKELKLSLSSFREYLRPGAKERWRLQVGAKHSAEILAYMFDKSLDLFGPHRDPNLLDAFPSFMDLKIPGSNLQPASSIWVRSFGFSAPPVFENIQGAKLQHIASYGVGGPGARHDFGYGTMNRAMKAMGKEFAVPAAASDGVTEESGKQEKLEPVRSNFAETAFWFPHLVTEANGTATFEFTVPDSVTGWHVWFHALTRDLQAGTLEREVQTAKELMVRPYLPRFLREGDSLDIRVAVTNSSDRRLEGRLILDIFDVDSGKSLLQKFAPEFRERNFSIEPDASRRAISVVSFPIQVPRQVGPVAIKVLAEAGSSSDGELREIPILPGRSHLVQSRLAVLKNPQRTRLEFPELLKTEDPTLINEQLVITLDAQLFYAMLAALPALLNDPYENSEQLVNRFAVIGILESFYKKYPDIQKTVARALKRNRQTEYFNQPDANRKMALEELPWLRVVEDKGAALDLLNPVQMKKMRDSALLKLLKAQNLDGGFPWFPGGRSDLFMSVYILYSFAKGVEFGLELPEEPIRKALEYVHREQKEFTQGTELSTFINYALSLFPNHLISVFTPGEREKMLDLSFNSWQEHSPYLKCLLALTLKRMNRPEDANLVWESVIDSSQTTEEQGTHWSIEDRTWLWYNDTLETQTFALRASLELQPLNQKLHEGLARWILLNKKMNHWKSTRATAEALVSLALYLRSAGELDFHEKVTLKAGVEVKEFSFVPEKYMGRKNQWIFKPADLRPQSPAQKQFSAKSTIDLEKSGKGYVFASASWHYSTEKLPEVPKGDFMSLDRKLFRRTFIGNEAVLEPISTVQVQVGDELEVQLVIRAKNTVNYVHLRDCWASGIEPVGQISQHQWMGGITWYEEMRDSGVNFFFDRLPTGEFTVKYRVRATHEGKFRLAPATLQGTYAPEFSAFSSGTVLKILQ